MACPPCTCASPAARRSASACAGCCSRRTWRSAPPARLCSSPPVDGRCSTGLSRRQHVVGERCHPSTFASHSAAGGRAGDLVLGLLRRWAGEPRPDLELILDLEAAEAAERRARAGGKEDRIESRGDAYMARVVEGYREYARSSAEGAEQGAVLVAANGSPDDVAARVREEVARVL